jgi:RimJ/RimL family protein N-acetyltransferase
LTGEVEPLIALHPKVCGRGYAAEVLERAIAHVADELSRSRLVALVDEPNTRSRRLRRRAGFEVVGGAPGPKHPLRVYALSSSKRRLDSRSMCG